MKFNRKKFFDGFRSRIDSTIEQEQVSGLEFILSQMDGDPFWKHIPQIAYALATVGWETAWSFQPVEEGYYLGSKTRVKAFQKGLRYSPYFGRGYVQLTWKANYQLAKDKLGIDFVNKPQLALEKELAYRILTYGMHQGWFTKKKLSDYINGSKTDYKGARRIINGTDKAGMIAGYARSFEQILNDSKIPTAVPAKHTPAKFTETKAEQLPAIEPPPETFTETTPAPVIEVQQISATPTEPQGDAPKEDTLIKIGNKFNALYTAAGASIIALLTFLTSTPLGIAISIIAAVALIGIVYMAITTIRATKKENREHAERIEREKWEANLKVERERQAFELTKLSMQSTMSKDLNSVTIASPPPTELAHSDSESEAVTA